ncbi:glycoside hydrolase family 16 protein [Cucurbitaria berberidis CBS 394.84]|uniref:chitinase n=1 Tax=Cucurbitaria berberidis CBS 394.84 TaxID=1168544 RepID=A0A9P4L3A9_9PLEO|nr:glycoside hydrolase family 16 protein [Cucurbitaria berberidis CBS 394.84]KAF1840170.1 glycoside hydrolase family 16 protein [Cucurbitaria berberidis CBS 394.84]
MHFRSYVAASALAALVTAQTFTDCNPTKKDCPNDPAMPKNWDTDFTAGKDAIKGWKQTAGSLTYGPEGAEFVIAKKGDAPTIGSETKLHFGYVEVTMKAAPGQGIISSIVLQSEDLDEVDWEWIGGVDSRVQMNYFGKGNTTTFDRMIEGDVANNQNEFHTYALNWTAEAITWIVDNKPLRTLKYADANGGKNFPQTPCNVRLGNWAGGDSENEGTRQWAGGAVDFKAAPFKMTVKNIKVINYSPGTEYKWTDKTGDFGSIEVIGAGNAEGAPQNTAVIKPSATPVAKGKESEFNYPGAGSVPTSKGGDSAPAKETPCECGVATVTVTGAPPPATNAPPATFTSQYSAVPFSSVKVPTVSSAKPPVTSAVSPPPYPTSGLAVDTSPAPIVPVPSAPTGVLPKPSGNATVSAPPVQFTGAASHNKAGVFVGALAGAVLLAF